MEQLVDESASSESNTVYRTATTADMTFVRPEPNYEVDCSNNLNDPLFESYCEIPTTYGQF